MAPDSMMIYTEDANRLVRVRVAVKEAVVRPIHKRRVAIAAVTDAWRVNPRTHAEMNRDHPAKLYSLSFEETDTAEAAYLVPT